MKVFTKAFAAVMLIMAVFFVAGTTYYVRAYAVNGMGESYGEQVSFTTPVQDCIPITLKRPI